MKRSFRMMKTNSGKGEIKNEKCSIVNTFYYIIS